MKFKDYLNESTAKKSSWNELIADLKENGLMFVNSFWARGEETEKEVTDKVIGMIDKNAGKLAFEVNRTYEKGSSNIGMKTERGSVSYIDKKGSVLEYKGYYLVVAKNNVVLYRHKD